MGKHKEKVVLNVYDLAAEQNSYLHGIGFGAYHSGVQFYGEEITFGQGGVFSHGPKQAGQASEGNCKFRESIVLGETEMTLSQVKATVIPKLTEAGFVGKNYNVLSRNCNHFSEALCQVLLNKPNPLPAWVNRTANWGNWANNLVGYQPQANTPNAPIVQQQQTFSGQGRTLREQQPAATQQAAAKNTSSSGGWFSWMGLGGNNTTTTTTTTPTTPTPQVLQQQQVATTTTKPITTTTPTSAVPEAQMTPDERRKKQLEATMNRLKK